MWVTVILIDESGRQDGMLAIVPVVTFSHALWWVARRSMRLLTSLILMALVLGLSAGGAEAAASPAPPAVASANPAAIVPVPAADEAAVTPPAAEAGVRVDRDAAVDWASAGLVTQPDRLTRSYASAQARTPDGAGYGFVFGQRAPPRG
jgi:hypothetical protein